MRVVKATNMGGSGKRTSQAVIDAEQYNYLVSVEDNLRALLQRTPPDTEVSSQTMRAINAIASLMECYVPDREPGE